MPHLPEPKTIAVIGAGIVGVSAAIWLQRAGHRVVLIDRKAAAGASYGNAGVLAAISIVPVATPGLLAKALRMIPDPDQPLFLRWRYLPKALPFLPRLLGNGRDNKVRDIARSLALMMHDCADQHVALAKGTGAEKYISTGDYVFGYADREAYVADAYAWGIRRAAGYQFEGMDQARFAEYDPDMGRWFGFGVRCPNHGHITGPGAYAGGWPFKGNEIKRAVQTG